MFDAGQLYREERERIIGLVEGLDEGGALKSVPTCPEWAVRDVVAHLAGVCDDLISGNIAGVGSDEWTAAQVAKRTDRPLAELLDEWRELGPQIDDMAPHLPGRAGAQLILDTATHEHDIRLTLGQPGAQDSDAVLMGVDMIVAVGFDAAVRHKGLPSLAVETPRRRWVIGLPTDDEIEGTDGADVMLQRIISAPTDNDTSDAEAEVTVQVPVFELFRALTGRRSRDQIAAWGWSSEPEPYLPAFRFGAFSTSPEPVIE